MSDQKLRELQRRWMETGSVEDEAAYLRERVRVGDLAQQRLELAAFCGSEAAKNVLEIIGLSCRKPPYLKDHFVAEIMEFGEEVALRAAHASTAITWRVIETRLDSSGATRVMRPILALLEECLLTRNGYVGERARELLEVSDRLFVELYESGADTAVTDALSIACTLGRAMAEPSLEMRLAELGYALVTTSPAVSDGESVVMTAILQSLRSWSLE